MNKNAVETAVNCKKDCWMHTLRKDIEKYSLTELFLVGSHNSGTYNISASSSFGCDAPGVLGKKTADGKIAQLFAKQLCSKWAKCQSLNVHEQLRSGVRYLDLRVVPKSSKNKLPYIAHSQISVPLSDVVHDIVSFLSRSDHEWECIVVDFQHIFVPEGMTLGTFLFPALDPLRELCIPNSVCISTPLKEIWSRSKKERVFMLIGDEFDQATHTFAHVRRGAVVSEWKNVQSCKDLLNKFNEDVALPSMCRSEILCVTQGVLTPEGKQIVESLFITKGIPTKFNSILDMARKVNAPICQWFWQRNRRVARNDEYQNVHRNILMLDYPEVTSLTVEVDDGRCSVECNPVVMCILLNLL